MTAPLLKSSRRFDLARLFQPDTIAVIGLDSEASVRILANLSVGGFRGEIRTVPDASQLGLGVDLAVLAIRRIRSATQ